MKNNNIFLFRSDIVFWMMHTVICIALHYVIILALLHLLVSLDDFAYSALNWDAVGLLSTMKGISSLYVAADLAIDLFLILLLIAIMAGAWLAASTSAYVFSFLADYLKELFTRDLNYLRIRLLTTLFLLVVAVFILSMSRWADTFLGDFVVLGLLFAAFIVLYALIRLVVSK